jgi:hypothetical protein
MLSLLPRHSDWGYFLAHSLSHSSLPRNGGRVGLCNVLFEACSAFTHVTACTLAGSPEVIRYIEGFSCFVTSTTAPIASGRSKIAGWDSHPLENAALARRTPGTDITGSRNSSAKMLQRVKVGQMALPANKGLLRNLTATSASGRQGALIRT